MSEEQIYFAKPYDENCSFIGMGGSGKSNALAYFLYQVRLRGARWVLFDGAYNHMWRVPEGCQIIHPPKYKALETFLSVCQKITSVGNLIFAVEEIEEFCKPQYMPPELEEIINRGRSRYHIAYWISSRRPAEVHGSIIASVNHHFIFKTCYPADVDFYKRYVGGIMEGAKDLPPHQFIYYRVGSSPIVMKPVKKVL